MLQQYQKYTGLADVLSTHTHKQLEDIKYSNANSRRHYGLGSCDCYKDKEIECIDLQCHGFAR